MRGAVADRSASRSVEPALALRLALDQGRVIDCRLVGEALPDPMRLLRGLPVETAIERVEGLMALCGRAHATALAAACEAAARFRPSSGRRAARALALLAERARALALRRTIAWPALIEAAARPERARPILAAAAALASAVGWTGPQGSLAPDRAAAEAAAGRLAEALAALADDPIPSRLLAAADALPAPLRSMLQRRLAARLARDRALALELRSHVARLRAEPSASPLAAWGAGAGIATTDRGPLRYRVRLAGGRLAAVEASSPTDRLLVGGDPLLAALVGFDAGVALERAGRLVLGLLDPCWPWRVELAVAKREPTVREPARA